MVEMLPVTTPEERERAIAEAGFNTFLLPSRQVSIDLLTDSGTNAMSDRQWSAMMLGDEAYAGSESFYRFEATIQRLFGYRHVIPTHQGRGAEHLLSRLMIREGDVVPGNMYFTTTRHHQEAAGGRFVDVIVDAAHDPADEDPFKGNVDLAKLERAIVEAGPGRTSYLSLEANVNMAGGQPFSLANLRETAALCRRHGVPIFLDATRIFENCWFIREREPGEQGRAITAILAEICALTDGATMSAKKDGLANIGGFLAVNDDALAENARNLCVVYEGLHTYGGLAGRDLEAVAVGLVEATEPAYLHARIGQVRYLADRIAAAGVPIVRPVGGHGVFVDAASVLGHLPREACPAQALAAAVYVDSGVRGMERGTVSAGRDPATGLNREPKLELLRLTLPRRVYTQAHMDVVAESVAAVWQRREEVVGLRIVHEPEHLRFFQARFAPLVGSGIFGDPAPRAAASPEVLSS